MLFVNAVRKLFFKMHLVLHLLTNYLDISHISSLGCPTFGLCFAWRYGDLATYSIFPPKMVLYIMRQAIESDVTIAASSKHKTSEIHLRLCMLENNG